MNTGSDHNLLARHVAFEYQY
ncbi:hypothetical protein D041_0288A, partial [Vibrio parahaemolyticus EKP-008]